MAHKRDIGGGGGKHETEYHLEKKSYFNKTYEWEYKKRNLNGLAIPRASDAEVINKHELYPTVFSDKHLRHFS